jgi:hypothetical protein
VVVCWVVVEGRVTAVSCVVVVVVVAAGLSDEQELKTSVARIESSDVRMVSFFIWQWYVLKDESSQVSSPDVLSLNFFPPSSDGHLASQVTRGVNAIYHLHQCHRLVSIVDRLRVASDRRDAIP